MASTIHVPVLVREVLALLVLNPSGFYLDASFGGGGHTRAILEQLDESARVLAIDRDPDAFERATVLAEEDSRVVAVHASFDSIVEVSRQRDFKHFDGILFDIGLSSDQLEDKQRGFSFQKNGPLDMRMDPSTGSTAADWLNSASERTMSLVIKKYGDERNAKAIARAVVEARPLSTTEELVAVINSASKTLDSSKHIATRTFQAVRIHINDELAQLRQGLRQAFQLINREGRIAVISFHSIEHRVVRKMFAQWTESQIPAKIPVRGTTVSPMKIVEKGLSPKVKEVESNPRSRSAVLQVIERVR